MILILVQTQFDFRLGWRRKKKNIVNEQVTMTRDQFNFLEFSSDFKIIIYVF